MDPNACLREMNEALTSQDWDTATDQARDLLRWITRGGFPPAGLTREETLRKVRSVLTRFNTTI